MKLSKEELNEIIELCQQAEEFKPTIRAILDILKNYSSELKEIPEAFVGWMREQRIQSIAFYESQGFDRDEAILMTLDDSLAINKIQEKMEKNRKG